MRAARDFSATHERHHWDEDGEALGFTSSSFSLAAGGALRHHAAQQLPTGSSEALLLNGTETAASDVSPSHPGHQPRRPGPGQHHAKRHARRRTRHQRRARDGGRAKRAATARPERLWDFGVIPYEIESNFSGMRFQSLPRRA